MNRIVHEFIDDLFDLDSFVHCAIEGIGYGSMAVEFTDRMRALGIEQLKDEQLYLERRRHFEKLETFAKKEASGGHPYLFGLASVKLCSIQEAAVDHVVVQLLKDSKILSSSPKLLRLKGPLVEFIGASEIDRIIYLRDCLKQELASDLKVGIGRFEALFEALGFAGFVAPSIRKALLELYELRNVIVHKMGKMDKQCKTRCPWLSFDVGEAVRVSHMQYRAHHNASLWYLIELDQRWGEKVVNEGREKDADDLLSEIETHVSAVAPYGAISN
jgi:hypothetical protein